MRSTPRGQRSPQRAQIGCLENLRNCVRQRRPTGACDNAQPKTAVVLYETEVAEWLGHWRSMAYVEIRTRLGNLVQCPAAACATWEHPPRVRGAVQSASGGSGRGGRTLATLGVGQPARRVMC